MITEVIDLDAKARKRAHDYSDCIAGWDYEKVDGRLTLVLLRITRAGMLRGLPAEVRGYSYRMRSDKANGSIALSIGMGRALKRVDHILKVAGSDSKENRLDWVHKVLKEG
jgi:hypothetical protein